MFLGQYIQGKLKRVNKIKEGALLSSIPSTHVGQFTMACNFNSREHDTVFWPARAPTHTCTYSYTVAHTYMSLKIRVIKVDQLEDFLTHKLHGELLRLGRALMLLGRPQVTLLPSLRTSETI